MLIEKLKEFKKKSNLSVRQIAEKSNLPERTVNRIFTGETPNPYIDTIYQIVTALDGTLNELFADTKLVVGNEDMKALQERLDVISSELELVRAENVILKSKVDAFTLETELLKTELRHKEELLAIHNYYTKLNTKGE